jgi:hypothetical protein
MHYHGKYVKCVDCYPYSDYCDCPNGVIRWLHRVKGNLILLRLGRDPYERGTITVQGQEAMKAEKGNKPRFYWSL